ncbi:C7orf31 [Bugula neritina]|uniref:C7orf31 n=1 Tax=Bugula neritina TaxID=10212 RepID=A0A7J7JXV8_BUGNE|nr:C7orf31 [Bugula neritina]
MLDSVLEIDAQMSSVPEWGTNKATEKVPLWSAKSPTWHQTGEPIEQFYDLTQLKKSNVRLNDQLLPKPQESTLGDKMIHLPFPAEHPYASHVPRLKMFPSFANTAEDPKKGFGALNSQPLSSEAPASSFDVQIVHKTKGTGDRHEIQSLPPESLKRGLSWHGEQGFPHTVKIRGDKQSYYPTPTSLVVPNLQQRQGTEQALSARSANATRNVERQQWKTTYDVNHTGIGPSNQFKLDNLAEKQQYKIETGKDDDEIYPWFKNTCEPSRPQEGRIAVLQNFNYGVPTSKGAAQPDTGYIRKPTLTEKEEDRLLNGKSYANLPTPEDGKDVQWQEWSAMHDPTERFTSLVEKQMRDAPNPLPVIERGTSILNNENKSYMDNLAEQAHDNVQQMEAQNRWQQLEAMKPAHSIDLLKRKGRICTPEEQVSAFYGHEGKYNEERAGLYQTSYDPEKLAYKLNSDASKLDIRNNVTSAKDALHYPTELNGYVDGIKPNISTDPQNVPMLSERPDIFEVFEPFKRDRYIRQQQLQPNIQNSRARVQEGDVILTKSTMGADYNTQKFLQEKILNPFARSEALAVMSSQNQQLANVAANAKSLFSSKQVKFDNQVTVGEGAGASPLKISKAHIETPKLILQTPQAVEPQLNVPAFFEKKSNTSTDYSSMKKASSTFRSEKKPDYLSGLTDTEKLFLSQGKSSTAGTKNLFASNASNLGIGATSYNMYQTSAYESQFNPQLDLSKTLNRSHSWEPGCGIPRPQSKLLKLQNSFSKSQAHRDLRVSFPEKNPSLIDNITSGKKHNFGYFNSQVLRGTLVNA